MRSWTEIGAYSYNVRDLTILKRWARCARVCPGCPGVAYVGIVSETLEYVDEDLCFELEF